MIRVAHMVNAEWYQDFCADYTKRRTKPRHRRKHDTKIERTTTIKALERIIKGDTSGTYAERLMPYLLAQIERMKGNT